MRIWVKTKQLADNEPLQQNKGLKEEGKMCLFGQTRNIQFFSLVLSHTVVQFLLATKCVYYRIKKRLAIE
jgi:hypothetical protein